MKKVIFSICSLGAMALGFVYNVQPSKQHSDVDLKFIEQNSQAYTPQCPHDGEGCWWDFEDNTSEFLPFYDPEC